jgi:hypothetical protein
MGRLTTPETKASNPGNQLEDFVREHVQQFIQALLEEKATELLGRTKSARREVVDAVPGYRNGYGKPRGLPLTNGTITVRRPRVCDLSERFVSRVLPLFKRQTKGSGRTAAVSSLTSLAVWSKDGFVRAAEPNRLLQRTRSLCLRPCSRALSSMSEETDGYLRRA